ncbi:uncharacterized protein LOC143224652 [Tachypleus tridentatus]|uniref:uncharacterized protein LOC143224652 n=1 Tax=Tachypleus tridentatus TaxID=6853 RepID=UPI003FD14A62
MENVNVTTRLNTNNTSRLIYDRRLHQKNEDILIISKPVRRYSQHVLDVINIKYVVKKEPEVKVNEIRSRITFSRPKERSRREDRDHEITLSSFNISKNTLNVSVRHLSHSFSPGGTDVGGGGVNTVALTYDNNLSSSPASSEAVVKEYSTEVFKSRETSWRHQKYAVKQTKSKRDTNISRQTEDTTITHSFIEQGNLTGVNNEKSRQWMSLDQSDLSKVDNNMATMESFESVRIWPENVDGKENSTSFGNIDSNLSTRQARNRTNLQLNLINREPVFNRFIPGSSEGNITSVGIKTTVSVSLNLSKIVSENENITNTKQAIFQNESIKNKGQIVSDDDSENQTVQIGSDDDSKNQTVQIVSDDDTKNQTDQIVSDDDSENQTDQIVSNDDNKNQTNEVVSDYDNKNQTNHIVSVNDNKNQTDQIVSNDDTKNQTDEAILHDESTNVTKYSAYTGDVIEPTTTEDELKDPTTTLNSTTYLLVPLSQRTKSFTTHQATETSNYLTTTVKEGTTIRHTIYNVTSPTTGTSDPPVVVVRIAGALKIIKGIKWKIELTRRYTEQYIRLSSLLRNLIEDIFWRSPLRKILIEVEIDGFSQGSVIVDFFVVLKKDDTKIDVQSLIQVFNNNLRKNTSLGNFTVDPGFTTFEVISIKKPTPTLEGIAEPSIPQWAIAVVVIATASLIFTILFGAVTMVFLLRMLRRIVADPELKVLTNPPLELTRSFYKPEDRPGVTTKVYGRYHVRRKCGPPFHEEDTAATKYKEWESKIAAAFENTAADDIYDMENQQERSTKNFKEPTKQKCDSWRTQYPGTNRRRSSADTTF